MSWAFSAIQALREGRTITICPSGDSMKPKISSGDHVTLIPCDLLTLQQGDIVLVRVNGHDYLHLIKGIRTGEILIGNAQGHLNGWTALKNIFGKVIKIEKGS